jgi:hypothetical protein
MRPTAATAADPAGRSRGVKPGKGGRVAGPDVDDLRPAGCRSMVAVAARIG